MTVLPVDQHGLAAIAHAHGALVHTDAAQAAGKIPIDVGALDVDLLTVAGHKMYAPKGIAALYVRPGLTLEPVVSSTSPRRSTVAAAPSTGPSSTPTTTRSLGPDPLADGEQRVGVTYLVQATVATIVVQTQPTATALAFNRTVPWLVSGVLFAWVYVWWGSRLWVRGSASELRTPSAESGQDGGLQP